MTVIGELSSEHFLFAWDHSPATPGHALVIPKRHVQFMRDLNETERHELIDNVLLLKDYISSTNLEAIYTTMLANIEDTVSRTFLNDALDTLSRFQSAPAAFNDGLNDGPAAGQTVPHFHWHVMPRWDGDIEDSRGGIKHMFAGKGNYTAN
jgi:diadenosine tetraphosphate (Ap4A) HIT family hydrolase